MKAPKEPRLVWGARSHLSGKPGRVVAAVDSVAEFCRVTGVTRHEATVYGAETVNPEEVVAARALPRTALYRDDFAVSFHGQAFRVRDGRIVTVRLTALIEGVAHEEVQRV
jgi:hypothetical protein